MKKYVGFYASDVGLMIAGFFAEDFDSADEQAEEYAKDFDHVHAALMWVEVWSADLRGEFDAVLNLFGEQS